MRQATPETTVSENAGAQTGDSTNAKFSQIVSFQLASEEFGLDIMKVLNLGHCLPASSNLPSSEHPFLNSGVVGENHVGGSGLGLAICKGFVAAHGGTISIETAKGKGTTVTVLRRADLAEPLDTGNAAEITCEVQQ